jgi:hypothetical protein
VLADGYVTGLRQSPFLIIVIDGPLLTPADRVLSSIEWSENQGYEQALWRKASMYLRQTFTTTVIGAMTLFSQNWFGLA